MIRLPQLSDQDVAIFRGKPVLLLGQNAYRVMNLYRIFKKLKIHVVACCCDEFQLSRLQKRHRLTVIKHDQLAGLCKQYPDMIVQSTDIIPHIIAEELQLARQLGMQTSPYSVGELLFSFHHLIIFDGFQNPIRRLINWRNADKKAQAKDRYLQAYQRKNQVDQPILICTPSKTGDYTLTRTFEQAGKQIDYCNLWHRPQRIDPADCEKFFSKTRIIMGLREPISQNLSVMFQFLSASGVDHEWLQRALFEDTHKARVDLVKRYQSLLVDQGDNAQALWDVYSNTFVYPPQSYRYPQSIPRAIQNFVPSFQQHVVDILAHPFDQEKGYTIIKEGNLEVFVYQLEKLNGLVTELSDFVGVPFDQLVRGNDASDKWIADSYKQAQKEINISQEYFDRCFNEPYVQHCYSQADIARFKEKWEVHVQC